MLKPHFLEKCKDVSLYQSSRQSWMALHHSSLTKWKKLSLLIQPLELKISIILNLLLNENSILLKCHWQRHSEKYANVFIQDSEFIESS